MTTEARIKEARETVEREYRRAIAEIDAHSQREKQVALEHRDKQLALLAYIGGTGVSVSAPIPASRPSMPPTIISRILEVARKFTGTFTVHDLRVAFAKAYPAVKVRQKGWARDMGKLVKRNELWIVEYRRGHLGHVYSATPPDNSGSV